MYKLFLIVILLFSVQVFSQDYIFFSDSPTGDYYDASWGYANAPSTLQLLGPEGNKFPVETNNSYSGLNCLKMNWNSKTGGIWEIAIAEDGWIPHDVTTKDSIIFYAFTDSTILSSELPQIYIEDINNNKTDKMNLSAFHGDIIKNAWQRVAVPLQIIKDNPGSADLTKIKTIFFGQSISDSKDHILLLDEVRMISGLDSRDTTKPSVPSNITAEGYDKHIEVSWQFNPENDVNGYNVYKEINSNYQLVGVVNSDKNRFIDFIGNSGVSESYKLTAFDNSLNESDKSQTVNSSTYEMNDEEFLDMLQKYTLRYFWEYGHPTSGLIRERFGSGNTCTIGGTGFGVMSIIAGIDRGFITRQEGTERIRKIVDFLLNTADKFHGAFPHWLNGETGKVIPFSEFDDGGDLVETAFLIQGLLAAKQYFNQNDPVENIVRSNITTIWQNVEWNWYLRTETSNFLYWHWSPNYDWQMNMRIQGPNETMIAYLLAIASPTHPIPANLYNDGWASSSFYLNGKSFYGYKLEVGWDYGGPLFFAHYSFLGFDPRDKKDNYTNYFNNNRNHTLINRAYCMDNPKNYIGYSDKIWGLTASDDPWGYSVHEPISQRDNGTITPTAALSSFPYTPEESMDALKSFYRIYGEKIWDIYGFTDAFNPTQNWYSKSYLSIDQGPIMVMVENYRSQLLWNLFMKNPEIKPMLDAIGFVEDVTGISENDILTVNFNLEQNYPNPFNPTTIIKYSIPSTVTNHNISHNVKLIVYDVLGNEIATIIDKFQQPGNYSITWNAAGFSNGIYYYQLRVGSFIQTKKMILLK